MFDGLQGTGIRVFTIAKIPINFSLWFFVICGLIIAQGNTIIDGIGFAIALTISILIHELGHAIPSKIWKLSPSILLHGLGGLCFHHPADTDNKDLIIVLSGPLLQIFVGLLGIGAIVLNGTFGISDNTHVLYFIDAFVYISLIWGLFNLLVPFYPLDGGQTMLLILRRFMTASKARDLMLKISISVSIPMIIGAFYFKFWILGLFLAYMVWDNLNAIKDNRQLIPRGTGRVQKSPHLTSMMIDIEVAFKHEEYQDAVRLCHVLRAEAEPIPQKQMDRVWEILFVANIRLGNFDEARLWKNKAPQTAVVKAATLDLPES